MAEVLLATLGPTVAFGLFAVLAMRFGAESRPYFDERPVSGDRPNWFPIAGSARGEDDEDDDEPGGGEPLPGAAPALRRQSGTRSVASPSRAATSPSGV
ncbi:MAG: hypothetical protein QOD81_1610 [Solirubrobacteraceae bacterium]|jgi:hypothetical protein|nr:hypothetical protein [Solirubrobacteraceae bacterium]